AAAIALFKFVQLLPRRQPALVEVGGFFQQHLADMPVQKLSLYIGPAEQLMGVLAVNFHQQFTQLCQLPHGGRAAVDPRPGVAWLPRLSKSARGTLGRPSCWWACWP